MNSDELERALRHVPLDLRADAREFARLSPEEQRIRLFVGQLELARKSNVRGQLAGFGYTTLVFGGLVLQQVFDWKPR